MVKTTTEFLELQPGVSIDGTNRIRGSDRTGGNYWIGAGGVDVKYQIDGITMSASDGRGLSGITEMTKSGIEEISVETGVMPAEYGDANGGFISMVSREGTQKYRGWFEYRYT